MVIGEALGHAQFVVMFLETNISQTKQNNGVWMVAKKKVKQVDVKRASSIGGGGLFLCF